MSIFNCKTLRKSKLTLVSTCNDLFPRGAASKFLSKMYAQLFRRKGKFLFQTEILNTMLLSLHVQELERERERELIDIINYNSND